MIGVARLAWGLTLGAVVALPLAAQTMYKCRDASGRVTYSDQVCQGPPPLRAAAPAPNTLTGGKLTEPAVEAVLRHALVLGERSDFRAQCALAARDLSFEITDHSTAPPMKMAGGRAELCDAQRDSARAILAAGMVPSIRAGKIDIRLNRESTEAKAVYESVTTLTHQGQAAMALRCSREETLRLYGSQILYSRLTANCRPAN